MADLLILAVITEVVVRGALMFHPVQVAISHRFGPDGSRLGWFYARLTGVTRSPSRYDPDLGWTNRPGAIAEGAWTADVDERGLRQPAPTSMEPTPGRRRILALGDSFGFGYDVSDDQTWFARLMVARPDVEVANLSVPGYDLGQALLRYRREGDAWQPDIVLLAFNELLAMRTTESFWIYERPLIPAETGNYQPVGVPVPDEATLMWQLGMVPHTWMLLRMARWEYQRLPPERDAFTTRRASLLLERFAQEVLADGRTLVVVWFPVTTEIETWVAQGEDGRKVASGWLRRCPRTAGVICLDPAAEMAAAHAAGQPARSVAHWSPEMNQVVGEFLARELSERQLP